MISSETSFAVLQSSICTAIMYLLEYTACQKTLSFFSVLSFSFFIYFLKKNLITFFCLG